MCRRAIITSASTATASISGAQVFAKVVSNDHWIEGGGGGQGGGGYHRDTFYVWLYPVEAAWPVIAQSWFYGGGSLTAALPSY
jgi:hypothetical protein